ncbi:Tenellin biosynthesis B [Hyphodiscus hymeniophilus]|uniref:Tenellin biosynthesis B n=1 Tax=Hyphodiscus hymeniophilus TaxID=353542 RepID=A0A9P7AWN9_9HELO|nr:Tenellin biosynthesis B [Hyphodiscus hymeniophilus]
MPDEILSQPEAFVEIDQAHHILPNSKIVSDPWQGLMVKKDMNSILEKLVVALDDELKFAFDARFGADTRNWTEITLYGATKKIVAQASSRFTVGLPMCRNEAYLDEMIPLPDTFVITAAVVGALPPILRPVIGRLFSIPLRLAIHRSKNLFRPLFNERVESLQLPQSEDPQDHLQMMLRFAQAERPQDFNLDDMTMRLAMANFGSFHQTSIMATNLIFNILESDKEYNTIALLREEAESCLAASGGVWTKAAAAQMVRADSVSRETMRINAFGNRSLLRKVMVDNVTTEDGIPLPRGAMVSILAHPAQCDGEYFSDPEKFDPFRFSRQREQARSGTTTPASENGDASDCAQRSKDGSLTVVSTGPQHIIFGHGRHACPGRFLLDFELKMIMAHLFAHYDVELLPEYDGKRPQAKWVAEATMPPGEGKIRVRRREKT